MDGLAYAHTYAQTETDGQRT